MSDSEVYVKRVIGTYRGRFQWVLDGKTWCTDFDPPLNVPSRSRMSVELPAPPPMGGPTHPVMLEFEWLSVDPATPRGGLIARWIHKVRHGG